MHLNGDLERNLLNNGATAFSLHLGFLELARVERERPVIIVRRN